MAITLDHTIVPAHDKIASAKWFADLLGIPFEDDRSTHFSPVRVGTLTFDFDNRDQFESHHYAFLLTEQEFDQIFARIKAAGYTYGSSPRAMDDMDINHRLGGRGLYIRDANEHAWEIMTRTHATPAQAPATPAGTAAS